MALEEVSMKRRTSFILGLGLLWVLAGVWALAAGSSVSNMLRPMLVLADVWKLAAAQQAQEPPNPPVGREMPGPGEHTGGAIVSVGVDRFTIKKADGTEQTVLVNTQTHFRQGRQQELQLEDLKPGDQIMVAGSANTNKEFVARMVRRVTQEELAQMPKPGEAVFGEIISINKDQLKVRNRMEGERVVVVNEQTTFMKEGQPITLKDLKVGDRIFARGKETNGQFVATQVVTGQSQRGGGQFRPRNEEGPPQ
jgi:hypothetical protein